MSFGTGVRCSAATLLLLCSSIATASTTTSLQRPHIVFLLADDLGLDDSSLRGSAQIPTPNLDALGYSGVLLDRYYVNHICTPSRSALMTGRYPIHTGMQTDVIYADQPYGLPLHERLLPQALAALGYRTHAIGKWHLGSFRADYTPTRRGFETHRGYWSGKKDYMDHTEMEGDKWGLDLHDGMELVRNAVGNYSTSLFTVWAEDVIQRHNSSEPLFLYIAHQAVHSGNTYAPLQSPQEATSRFPWIKDKKRRTFAGMLQELDASVGRVVTALRAKDMLKDSVLVFSTDNGGPNAGVDGNVAYNWPLRGVKYTLWEGGVRGTGFLWSPRVQSAAVGSRSRHLMHITDWLPTLYSAAGGDVRDLGSIDGVDMWSALTTAAPASSGRAELLHNIDPSNNYSALMIGKYKYIVGQPFPYNDWYADAERNSSDADLFDLLSRSAAGRAVSDLNMAVTGDQYRRLVGQMQVQCGERPAEVTTDCSGGCVFDLQRDPCEYRDVSQLVPRVRRRLEARLAEYRAGMVESRKVAGDPRANPKYWGYAWVNWQDYYS